VAVNEETGLRHPAHGLTPAGQQQADHIAAEIDETLSFMTVCASPEEAAAEVQQTVKHEIAHHYSNNDDYLSVS
jgi:predicted Zn-dependent protease with MMP-like domain